MPAPGGAAPQPERGSRGAERTTAAAETRERAPPRRGNRFPAPIRRNAAKLASSPSRFGPQANQLLGVPQRFGSNFLAGKHPADLARARLASQFFHFRHRA